MKQTSLSEPESLRRLGQDWVIYRDECYPPELLDWLGAWEVFEVRGSLLFGFAN
jgi:hypothetical protein